MKFETTTIRGHGRGKGLGFPTINLLPPDEFALVIQDGIYAVRVTVGSDHYKGALFYGPVPVFDQKEKSLEIYLLDAYQFYLGIGDLVSFEIIKYIRPVMNFSSPELMVIQMGKDIEQITSILKDHA